MSTGRSDWFFRWGLVSTAVVVSGFLIGIRWGAIGVATSYCITNLILLYPNFKIPFSLISLSMKVFLTRISPFLGIGIIMALVALLWRAFCDKAGVTQPPFVLASTSAIGALVYSALILRLNPPGTEEIISFLPLDRIPWLNRIVRLLSGRNHATAI